MPVCTYDNPSTMRRECWQDGRLIYSLAFEVLLAADTEILRKTIAGGYILFFGANIGAWKAGQIVGDATAIHPT